MRGPRQPRATGGSASWHTESTRPRGCGRRDGLRHHGCASVLAQQDWARRWLLLLLQMWTHALVGAKQHVSHSTKSKKIVEPFLDLCVSSLRRGHANLLCIVPILTDVPKDTQDYRVLGLYRAAPERDPAYGSPQIQAHQQSTHTNPYQTQTYTIKLQEDWAGLAPRGGTEAGCVHIG